LFEGECCGEGCGEGGYECQVCAVVVNYCR